ncbi:hypothetical protein DFH09DRAFT_1088099 [Mycena vulgaris]|nr:hypothetical protein DFH09DRAFT_1088099 [Mycena vulgaris]
MDRVRRTETVHSGRPRNAYDEGHAPRSNTKNDNADDPSRRRRPSTAPEATAVARLANILASTLPLQLQPGDHNTAALARRPELHGVRGLDQTQPLNANVLAPPHAPPRLRASHTLAQSTLAERTRRCQGRRTAIHPASRIPSAPRSDLASHATQSTRDAGRAHTAARCTGRGSREQGGAYDRRNGTGNGNRRRERRGNRESRNEEKETMKESRRRGKKCRRSKQGIRPLQPDWMGPTRGVTLLLRRRAANPALLAHTALGIGERTRDLVLVVVVVLSFERRIEVNEALEGADDLARDALDAGVARGARRGVAAEHGSEWGGLARDGGGGHEWRDEEEREERVWPRLGLPPDQSRRLLSCAAMTKGVRAGEAGTQGR